MIPDPRLVEAARDDTDDVLLARLVFGEARGEQDPGPAAVAHVVLNRTRRSKRFGVGVRGVALKRSQFSCFGPGPHLDAVISPWAHDSTAWARCFGIAHAVLTAAAADPTGGATHYLATRLYESARCPRWARGPGIEMTTIGGHVFLRGVT